MTLDRNAAEETLALAARLALITADERDGARRALDAAALAPVVAIADSAHLHVAVPSIDDRICAALREAGGVLERARDGYVKHAFASGLHVVLSSIATADDHSTLRARSALDHLGVDVRRDDDDARARADDAVRAALACGWRHVAQGDGGAPVACCHASVARKHWLFRDGGAPVELALGPLVVHADAAGRDLRPIDPARATAAATDEACCAPAAVVAPASSLLRPRR